MLKTVLAAAAAACAGVAKVVAASAMPHASASAVQFNTRVE